MAGRLPILCILLVASCCHAATAPEQWIEARNPHFRVLTDSSEKQAVHVLDQFERIRWMFHTLFPGSGVDPVEPIIVIAAKNARSFQRFEPPAYLEKGQLRVAGVFTRVYDKNYVLLRLDAASDHPFAEVYHEYTHLQLSGDFDWMPLWLNEGLAEFFQNTEIREKDVWLGGPSPENILYMRQRQLIPLKVLFKIDRSSPYYHEEQKGTIFYAESWALTHYLEFADRSEGTHRINDYLTLLRAHEDPLAAAGKAFGDLTRLEVSLESYIRKSTFRQFVLPGPATPIDESKCTLRRLTGSEADTVRADVLVAVKRDSEARTLLGSILKVDPENTQAHDTMGTLEYRDGNRDAALKWYREAVRLGSDNYFAYFNFANLAMADEKAWDNPEIESSLRTAIRLNPRYYQASEFLATLLSSQNRDSDAIAVMDAAHKVAANPRDTEKATARIVKLEQAAEEHRRLAERDREANSVSTSPTPAAYDSGPRHPTETASGPKHEARGVIRNVQCTYPAIIEFRVDGTAKSVTLYNNDFTAIEYTVLGFLPKGYIHPCDELEGMRVRVRYVDSSDTTVDGQVIAMELRK